MTAPSTLGRQVSLVAAILVALLLIASSPSDAQGPILFAQINSAPPVNSNQFVDIPGLSFQLPAMSATQKSALIILNVPTPYAEGVDFPGINFGVNVNGQVVASGGFTYPMKVPQSFGRMPFTLVVKVPLKASPLQVRAQWVSVRNSTGKIDSFASLSAIIGNN